SMDIKDSPKQGRMIEELDKDEDVNLILLNIKRISSKDKGKGIMQETELPKKSKKKDMIQLSLVEELAQKLYAQELAKNAARQDQERKNMIMYLKNQGGYKQSHFKGMKYEDIKPIFERVWDQFHTFVPKDSEIEKEVMKRAGFDLQQENSKKQRLDQQTEQTKEDVEAQGDSDQEIEEIKLNIRIIPNEDIAIDAIPLATKPSVIIEYKIVKEGKINTYLIKRAYGSTKRNQNRLSVVSEITNQYGNRNIETTPAEGNGNDGGYTPRSEEGRLTLLELMNIYTILSNRVTTLETELSSTKVVYPKAFITLTKRVKKLETQLKQKRSRAVIHSSDE
nr:hypothetical protein [Tanacetum cinerariifolium]